MKYSKYVYYLFTILCPTITSCSSDADGSFPTEQATDKIEIQLSIQFPGATMQGDIVGGTGTDQGTANERNINQVDLYVFEAEDNTDNTTYYFREKGEVKSISTDPITASRIVSGVLSKSYTQKIKIVVLANSSDKGINSTPGTGTLLDEFYKTLTFSRIVGTWPLENNNNLPMWGECANIGIPKGGGKHSGSLNMLRTVAKINVLVNEEKGLTDNRFFKINTVQICQYNDLGYCAPLSISATEPHVPASASSATKLLEYNRSSDYACKDRIYIPEQQNNNVSDSNRKIYLRLNATINEKGDKKDFNIYFKKDGKGADFDVIRNTIYTFNITKVETNVNVDVTFEFKVEPWDVVTVTPPPFS